MVLYLLRTYGWRTRREQADGLGDGGDGLAERSQRRDEAERQAAIEQGAPA
jgi:hypothetical protein